MARVAKKSSEPELGDRLEREIAAQTTTTPVAEIDLVVVWDVLRRRMLWILVLGLGTAVIGYLGAMFGLPKYYQATAVLRPVSKQQGLTSRLGSMLSGGALQQLMGVGLDAQGGDAQEYLAILKSYQFTIEVINHHRLWTDFANKPGFLSAFSHGRPPTKWQTYKQLQHDFEANYDRFDGNMTLTFVSHDPDKAVQILGMLIDDLRDRLRNEEVASAEAAVKSLNNALQTTNDAMLQQQLYELLAMQLQREKLAEVEAELDFKVIEPPMVPDKPFKPRPVLDGVLAALLVMFLAATLVLFRYGRSGVRRVGGEHATFGRSLQA